MISSSQGPLSTWQHTTLTKDRHPCPRWDSNPQSQAARGRKPTLLTARPLRTALYGYLFLARLPPVGHGLLIHEVSRSHTTHHSREDSSGRIISSCSSVRNFNLRSSQVKARGEITFNQPAIHKHPLPQFHADIYSPLTKKKSILNL